MRPASILITDDENSIRLMLRTALETDGYNVLEASNGRQAMEIIKTQSPDLMVLDLNMPVMDGMSVLEALRSLTGATKPKVIVLTAYGSIPAAVKATRLGAIDFLEKPITPTELRQTIASVLEEPELDVVSQIVVDLSAYEKILERIRKTLRLADYPNAEALLTKAAEQKEKQSAAYFNLLGVLYEAQQKWRLARKCYVRALTIDERYHPAKSNLQRLGELQTYGRSTHAILLGDEAEDLWFSRIPESQN